MFSDQNYDHRGPHAEIFAVFCVLRHRQKPRSTRQKPPGKQRHTLERLAAEGRSGDVIAATLGINKNRLRAEHALDLQAGRETKMAEAEKAAANAVTLNKDEKSLLSAIRTSFANGYWIEDGRNVLFGDARTEKEAFENVQSFGRCFQGIKWEDVSKLIISTRDRED